MCLEICYGSMFKMYVLENNTQPVVLNVLQVCFLAVGSFPKMLENHSRYKSTKYNFIFFYCTTQGNEFERN